MQRGAKYSSYKQDLKGLKMIIKKKTFEDLMDLNTEGLVLLGCGGDLNEWIDGVTEILVEENIVQSADPLDTFDKPFM